MHSRCILGAGLVAIALTGCGSASKDPAWISAEGKETYQALMEIDTALGKGVPRDHYDELLVEARTASVSFFARNLSGNEAELAKPLKTALEAFTTADKVMQIQAKADEQIVTSGNVYYKELMQMYPPAAKLAKEVTGTGTSELHFPRVLGQIFNEANTALAEATRITQRQ